MRRLGIVFGILAILFVGGALSILLSDGGSSLLPFLQQTADSEASTLNAESWQAEQLFLLIGFILFNMVGIGVTIAAIMWFLHRNVATVRSGAAPQSTGAAAEE